MATMTPQHNPTTYSAVVDGHLQIQPGTMLNMAAPTQPMEFVPDDVMRTLTGMGWNGDYVCDNRRYFTHKNHAGHYSWSEALTLQTARAFLGLSK